MNKVFRLCAVIVIYEELLEESSTYNTLLKELNIPYMVYDNSHEKRVIEKPNVHYVHNPSNPGVTKAYNEAINWALEIGYSHLLLLDSDSTFPPNSFEVYSNHIKKFNSEVLMPSLYSSGNKVSPFYFKFGRTFYGNSIKKGVIELGEVLPINSACVLPLKQIKGLFYDESLTLDWSDIKFFRELAKSSIKARHIDLNINHDLSEDSNLDIGKKEIRFTCYLKGIKIVSSGFLEKSSMYFWASLKALKLSLTYRSFTFIRSFLKEVNA